MKIIIAVLAIAAFIACTSAAALPGEVGDESMGKIAFTEPEIKHTVDEEYSDRLWIDDHGGYDGEKEVDSPTEEANSPRVRRRRFTCDVFSFSSAWVTPNHTACALKCVGKGRKGGHCEGQMCKCRDGSWIH